MMFFDGESLNLDRVQRYQMMRLKRGNGVLQSLLLLFIFFHDVFSMASANGVVTLACCQPQGRKQLHLYIHVGSFAF